GDGPLGEEESGGDLPVRPALGDESGDSALGRRQPVLPGAPAHPADLGARRGRPAGGTDRLEPRERSLDRLAGRPLLPCPPADDAERQQRSSTPEGITDLLVACDRLLEQDQPLVDASAGRGDETPAARYVRQHPFSAEPGRIRLPDIEQPPGVVGPAELEQRRVVVGGPPAEARLAPAERPRALFRLLEPADGRRRISLPELDAPQDGRVLGRVESELLLGQREGSLRMLTRELQLTSVNGDHRDRKVVLGHLEPVLDGDVVRGGGVSSRELPASRPELDPREAPERTGAPRLVAISPFPVVALEQGARFVGPAGGHEGAREGERRLLDEPLAPERVG